MGTGLTEPETIVTARDTPWSERFAQRTHSMTSSAIRELLKLTETPQIISFAGGLPAPERTLERHAS